MLYDYSVSLARNVMLNCYVVVVNTVVCVVHMMGMIVTYGILEDSCVYVAYDVYGVSSLLLYVLLPLYM